MSRYLVRFVSAILLFGMIGGIGMHSLAAEAKEVRAVRQQFSTSEEVTSICIEENGAPITIRSGTNDQIYVNYANSSEEKLYNIYVDNETLVVEKLKENPSEAVVIDGNIFINAKSYSLEIILPQKKYESIVITNSSDGGAEFDSIYSKNINIELEAGSAKFSQTQSDTLAANVVTGSIVLDHTNSLKYDCKVETGRIKGDVTGHYNDYSVDVYIETGMSNLSSHRISTSENSMKLYVGTGSIEVDFVNW